MENLYVVCCYDWQHNHVGTRVMSRLSDPILIATEWLDVPGKNIVAMETHVNDLRDSDEYRRWVWDERANKWVG